MAQKQGVFRKAVTNLVKPTMIMRQMEDEKVRSRIQFANKVQRAKIDPAALLSPRAYSQQLLARPNISNQKDLRAIML